MTLTLGQTGPGQEIAPAFVVRPLDLHDVDLTWHDALVWEQLPRELTGWGKFRLIAVFAVMGMSLAMTDDHLPPWFSGMALPIQTLLAAAFGYLFYIVLTNFLQRIKARRRFPNKVRVRTRVLPDSIRQSWDSGCTTQRLADTRQTICTPSHLFLESAQSLVILPLACFDNQVAMTKFAENWESASLGLSERQDMELPLRP